MNCNTTEQLTENVKLICTQERNGMRISVVCTHTLERYDALTEAEANYVRARLTRKYSGVEDIHTLLALAED